MNNLKYKLNSFDSNRNAWLVDASNQQNQVFVPASVLKQAFITRAWLERTIIDCAVGKCYLGAEVEKRGNRQEAIKVWLSLERNITDEPRGSFKNFGLELNKPKRFEDLEGSNLIDLTNIKESINKLSQRFSPAQGDLCNFRFDNDFLERLSNRNLAIANALAPNGLVQADFTPDWRMVTGMGEASVYETNMTLHPVYGIPYIPASTVKGVLRHYLTEMEVANEEIEMIFGNDDENSTTRKPVKGQCIFFDAFPLKAPRIELDVMTPHYPDYYSGEKPPADWQSPTPIYFLTVGHGTPFRFFIGLPPASTEHLRKTITTWLNEALQHKGLGAKTSVGYGYWAALSH